MKRLLVGTEFQYKSNGKAYYKVLVECSDGSVVRGSRTLRSFTGSALERVKRQVQEEIDNGAWEPRGGRS